VSRPDLRRNGAGGELHRQGANGYLSNDSSSLLQPRCRVQ